MIITDHGDLVCYKGVKHKKNQQQPITQHPPPFTYLYTGTSLNWSSSKLYSLIFLIPVYSAYNS